MANGNKIKASVIDWSASPGWGATNLMQGNGNFVTPAAVVSGAGAFVNNGNTFGADATIGLNDGFALKFETANTTRFSLDGLGNLISGNWQINLDGSIDFSGTAFTIDSLGNVVSNTIAPNLILSGADTVFNVNTRELFDSSGGTVINFETNILYNSFSNEKSIDWGNYIMYDNVAHDTISIDYSSRYLQDSSGNIILDWNGNNIGLFSTAVGNLSFDTIGSGLMFAEGSNGISGVATLVGGTKVVNTTMVAANSRILLTGQNSSGTAGELTVSARTAGTSFTITSLNALDTRSIYWLIISP